MGKAINAVLKLSIIAAVVLASSSVAYYYLVYLPDRDARIDAEKQALEQRLDAEKQALEQRQQVEKSEAQTRYQSCLADAQYTYNSTWAANCKQIAVKSPKDYAACLAGGTWKSTCDRIYGPDGQKDPSPNCSLPGYIADGLGANLRADRNRCLQESKSGL